MEYRLTIGYAGEHGYSSYDITYPTHNQALKAYRTHKRYPQHMETDLTLVNPDGLIIRRESVNREQADKLEATRIEKGIARSTREMNEWREIERFKNVIC